ncbi:hypothetical protein Hanom_Chr15g01372651 [Helianthus anomalus]
MFDDDSSGGYLRFHGFWFFFRVTSSCEFRPCFGPDAVRASRFGSVQASQRVQYDSTWFQFTWFSKFRARFRFWFGSRVTGQILKWCGRLVKPSQLS